MWPLTRYFLENLFGRQLLDEDGLAALRRVLASALGGVAALALYLPRMLNKKYADLDALTSPIPYREALVADALLMICLVMMLTALAAALVAPAIFPSEVDYVTLTPLPLSRRRIFGAKVLALLVFAFAFILAGVVLFAFSFPMFTHGQWAESGYLVRIGSFTLATGAAATFAFLAMMAVQGVILAALPRRTVARASLVVQSAAIGGVILAAPFVFDLGTDRAALDAQAARLGLFPPAWFLGLEQTMLGRGDAYFGTLATSGLGALATAAGVALVCYGWLYRRPERLASLPPRGADSRAPRFGRGGAGRRHAGAWTAIWMFATATLGRNRLPQLVYLVAWAVGLAVVVSGLRNGLDQMWSVRYNASQALEAAAIAMPLVLALLAVAGLRAAFLLPVALQANWVFRMTDWAPARAARLDAVEQAFVRLAIAPALLLSAPVLIAVLGVGRGLVAVLLATLACAVLLELVLTGWRRVPFTCTWLPGKRPLPFAVTAVLGVLWITASAADSVAWALRHPPRGAIVLGVLLLTAAVALRFRRRRSWAADPLEFEDEPFDAVQRLGLGPG